jgi:hypothetical protein
MYWVLLDVLLGLLAVVLVGLTGFTLYKQVRTLMRAVGTSSSTLADAQAGLGKAQASQRR